LFGFLAAFALLVSGPAKAEDPTVSFSGLVDTYYTFNFANDAASLNGRGNTPVPTKPFGFYPFNPSDNSFTLGLAKLGASITAGDVSGNIVLMYGESATALSLGDGVGDLHLMAANVTYTKDKWAFTFGKFMTWVGNEVVETNANMNYSRSILFYGIPLFHTGLSIAVTPDDQFGATLFVTNGWNTQYSYFGANFGEKTFGLQLKFNPAESNLGIVLNGAYGPEPYGAGGLPTLIGEAIFTYQASEQFTVAADLQMGMQTPESGDSASYIGAALYGKLALENGWGIALRLENVIDNGTTLLLSEGTTDMAAEYREVTLTVENQITPNMLARLEGRMDMDYFDGAAVPAYAGGEESQFTLTASTVFSF
jgi:hypothetical protein